VTGKDEERTTVYRRGLRPRDIPSLLKILRESHDASLRKSSLRLLGRLIGDNVSSEKGPPHTVELSVVKNELKQLFTAEKDMEISAIILRVLNRLEAVRSLAWDPARSFDRDLGEEEAGKIFKEVTRLKDIYNEAHGQGGAFDQRYEVLHEIATGGMCRIVRGIRKEDKVHVAIKFLLERFLDTPEVIKRFHRESEILIRLRHRNIVSIYERGEVEGCYYIVMEFMEGGSLDDYIGSDGVEYTEGLSILCQVCEALDMAHENGIIHRDIKPGNVLLTRDRVAKLTDFGLAKDTRASELTTESTVMGTEVYMAPEQRALSKGVDRTTDIYSMGVMIYEVLSGGELPVDDYPSLNQLTEGIISREVDEVVEKCLKRRPGDRFQSAGELKKALSLSWQGKG